MTTDEPPHLYTAEEWAALTDDQRRTVALHRRRAVEWARLEHETRYRAPQRLAELADATKPNGRNHP